MRVARSFLVFSSIAACMATSVGTSCSAPPDMVSSSDPTMGVDPDCDPIAPEHCGFPFPNDRWLSSGHVAFGKGTLPLAKGVPIDPAAWADAHGFSAGQAPMTFLANATATGL